ncbi:MAG: efflux RND transporter periplasmic adaptor subunit [Pseudomonadota bacterium]|nr:efflux RND transporter periplasmic adaptor subunit [Pseudomonadota bacterium]
MSKRMLIMLIIVGVIFGGVFGFETFRGMMIKKYMTSMGAPPQTVSTAVAGYEEWQPRLEAVGSLRAVRGVDISNELAGIVQEIRFDSGGDVKEGTLLLKLRADDDIAKLHSLEAAARLADTNLKRDRLQFKVQAISQAQFDADAATLDSDKAQVAEQKAIVDKKMIRAPFDGHLGIRNVDLGQYINPGTAIVTLQQLDPIYLDFTLPQQAVADVRPGQKIAAKNDAYPGKEFAGRVLAVSPKVDPATRNVQLRAQLDNSDHALLPGMYATAYVEVGEKQRYITLPQTAITYNPYGNTVFLVEDKGKDDKGQPQLVAHQTFVTTGEARGDQIAILKGIKEGDTVVTSGQIKLQNGTKLIVNNSIQPTADSNPKPQDQ